MELNHERVAVVSSRSVCEGVGHGWNELVAHGHCQCGVGSHDRIVGVGSIDGVVEVDAEWR